MTFISELDLDIAVAYLHAKNKVNRSNGSKVIIWTDKQTDRQTDTSETFTVPLSLAVIRDKHAVGNKSLVSDDFLLNIFMAY